MSSPDPASLAVVEGNRRFELSARLRLMVAILLEHEQWIDSTTEGEIRLQFNAARKVGSRRISTDFRLREVD